MAFLKPEFWMKFIEKFGFNAFLVLMIGYYVIIPLKDGHLKFLDSLAASAEKSADGVQKLSNEVGEARSSLDGIDRKLSRALEAIGKQ